MNREDRAKQFMPFDALKGLKEELRKRELKRLKVRKHSLTEYSVEIISNTLKRLKNGSTIDVVFYVDGYYLRTTEVVESLNLTYKYIKTKNNKIFFEDILSIDII